MDTSSRSTARRAATWAVYAVGAVSAVFLYLAIQAEQRSVMRDRERETRLLTALSRSHVAIAVLDRDGTVTLTTDAMADLTGYSREELVGSPVDKLISEDARPSHLNGYRESMARGGRGEPVVFVCRVVRKDGSVLAVRNTVFGYSSGGIAIMTPAPDSKETN